MTRIEEKEIARDYVLKRKLIRPKTNILSAVIFSSFLLLVSFIMSIIVKLVFVHIPFTFVFLFALFLMMFIFLKKIIIGTVEIYQHYMPEQFRRRCLCMPTCSEYMILAVKKYGALKGMRRGLYRLIYICRGGDYKIDYP
ncbi:MAG: membrane protein insertion efficiency factor YidD [Treponema sp.]|jgi:putative component of membrane protein insertase Oxa1/YidC/SpoIIIJ protein YidD|nr:membrane protein insertion efficiency factor YidD [Treponema sp.]